MEGRSCPEGKTGREGQSGCFPLCHQLCPQRPCQSRQGTVHGFPGGPNTCKSSRGLFERLHPRRHTPFVESLQCFPNHPYLTTENDSPCAYGFSENPAAAVDPCLCIIPATVGVGSSSRTQNERASPAAAAAEERRTDRTLCSHGQTQTNSAILILDLQRRVGDHLVSTHPPPRNFDCRSPEAESAPATPAEAAAAADSPPAHQHDCVGICSRWVGFFLFLPPPCSISSKCQSSEATRAKSEATRTKCSGSFFFLRLRLGPERGNRNIRHDQHGCVGVCS
mmetsp:Transcript_15811/g.32051  ORF Transcript_15811/g.32051 Transcript_15811/m.32051 type:complete len:280 (-) Transcript_15811:89-928(-)